MPYDFEFSDAGDRIEFASHGDYTTVMSASLWVKVESNPGTNQTNYLIKGQSDNTDRNFFFTWTPAGGGDVYVGWSRSDTGANNEWKIDYTPTVGAWTQFYFSIDWTQNPDVVRIWANGVEQTVTLNFGVDNIGPLTTATQLIYVGGPPAGDPNFTDGLIADVAIWNNLDTTRVAKLQTRSVAFYPDSRIECMLLTNSPENLEGGIGTVSGAVLSTDYPPIVYPKFLPNKLRPAIFTPGRAR